MCRRCRLASHSRARRFQLAGWRSPAERAKMRIEAFRLNHEHDVIATLPKRSHDDRARVLDVQEGVTVVEPDGHTVLILRQRSDGRPQRLGKRILGQPAEIFITATRATRTTPCQFSESDALAQLAKHLPGFVGRGNAQSVKAKLTLAGLAAYQVIHAHDIGIRHRMRPAKDLE